MDADLFKVAGAVAGIGGIAFASVVYIFREVIRKEIFPQLTKEQAYTLVNRIIVLTFTIGVLGVAAYVAINLRPQRVATGTPTPTPTPSPDLAQLSGTVLDESERPIQGAKVTIDETPGMRAVGTSSDGIFTITGIPAKSGDLVKLRVVKEGYLPNPRTDYVVIRGSPPRVILRRKK